MVLRIEAFPLATWPLPIATLHWAYLIAGLLIAAQYVPLLLRAWRHIEATATAQSLPTWATWTACRVVACLYGVFVLHDLLFVLVVGADVIGRFAMVALILRARLYVQLRQQILADRAQATPARAPLREWKVVRPQSVARHIPELSPGRRWFQTGCQPARAAHTSGPRKAEAPRWRSGPQGAVVDVNVNGS